MNSSYQNYVTQLFTVKQQLKGYEQLIVNEKLFDRIEVQEQLLTGPLAGFTGLHLSFQEAVTDAASTTIVDEQYQRLSSILSYEGTLLQLHDQWEAVTILNIEEEEDEVLKDLQSDTTLATLAQAITSLEEWVAGFRKRQDLKGLAQLHAHSKSRRDIAKAADLDHIKGLIKEHSPQLYDEITVLDEERSTHYLVEVERRHMQRQAYDIRFGIPEASISSYTDKYMKSSPSDHITTTTLPFSQRTLIQETASQVISSGLLSAKQLPLKKEANGNVAFEQPSYVFPEHNAVVSCNRCDTHKYVTCSNCSGTHQLPCKTCRSEGQVQCPECAGTTQSNCSKCSGSGETRCRKCSGSEWVACRSCSGTGRRGDSSCRKCNNGKVKCTSCRRGFERCGSGFLSSGCGGSGKEKCYTCEVTGYVTCPNCKGAKYFECKSCYGNSADLSTFGKVDCDGCKAKGHVGHFSYATTVINTSGYEATVSKVPLPDPVADIISRQKTKELSPVLIQEFFPGEPERNRHDTATTTLVEKSTSGEALQKGKLITERILFEAIPVTIVRYLHTLTNKEHKLALVGYDDAAQMVMLSNPREGLNHVGKLRNFVRKVFNTKTYKNKTDSRNEIVLLIYLAKVDGIIEEHEKRFILESGKHLTDFTKEEQEELFNLMTLDPLPSLDKKYTHFSSLEAERKVAKKMSDMIKDEDDIDSIERDLSYYLTML